MQFTNREHTSYCYLPKGAIQEQARKVRLYWTTLGEGGGRITLPSPVAPAMGHLFLIIERRVRRVGHFIKKNNNNLQTEL